MKKSTVQELLGRRIGNLRKAKNMTREELAAKCHLQLDFVEAIEKGKEDSSLEDLAKISKALSTDLLDLVREERGKEDSSKIKREILEIVDEMERKDKRNLKLILEILRAMR